MSAETENGIKIDDGIPKVSRSNNGSILRLSLNYTTNILMVLIVFICLLFAFQTGKFGAYELHIVLCVLGYQLFMSQGILVLSKYNYWSMYMSRRYRIQSHLVLQALSVIMITAGTIVMCNYKQVNFNTVHGILALCALIMSVMSSVDGLILMYGRNITSCISAFWIKCGHYILGVAGLACSAASLCYGYKKRGFKLWTNNDDNIVIALIVSTSVYTILVLAEFCFAIGNRLRS